MSKEKNKRRIIYFMGIGGIGMSALAQYYLKKGYQIFGSDLESSEITKFLEKLGAKIFIGENKNLKSLLKVKNQNLPESIIYTPAIPQKNPELQKAKKLGIKCQSYPQALGELTKKYFTIAVSGTHGKSTTTVMIGLILIKAGLDPTVIVGTKLREFGNSNFRMGQSSILVIEADEHFASFLNYWPKIIVLTNIEREHLDYYKNLRNILKTYKEYINHLPKEGKLIANQDDKNIKKILKPKYNTISTAVENVLFYSLKQKEVRKLKKILKIPGAHNISNALAALTVARLLKIPDKIIFKALSEYQGAWRRFEIKELKIEKQPSGESAQGRPGKLKIVNDYAHHPTEIKATLKAVREKWPKKEIWCIFQPHQYQRTFYLFDDFVKVFQESLNKNWIQKLIITDIFDVAGREDKKIKNQVNSQKLAKAIKTKISKNSKSLLLCSKRLLAQNVIYLSGFEKIADYLKKNLRGGQVLIIMGAGDIYQLCEQF